MWLFVCICFSLAFIGFSDSKHGKGFSRNSTQVTILEPRGRCTHTCMTRACSGHSLITFGRLRPSDYMHVVAAVATRSASSAYSARRTYNASTHGPHCAFAACFAASRAYHMYSAFCCLQHLQRLCRPPLRRPQQFCCLQSKRQL